MTSYQLNIAIRHLADINDFPNDTEILEDFSIVLICEKNKTREIRISSQLGLTKWKWLSIDSHGLLPLNLWNSVSVNW